MNPVPNVYALEPLDRLPLHRGMENPDPSPLPGDAGNDAVKPLAGPRFEEQGSRRLLHPPLNLGCRVFRLGV
jgi:hypothetical protein